MPAAAPLTTDFLATVSTGPGVYQMLGNKEVLYVGKAVNLRKRLSSYKRYLGNDHHKTGVMLSKTRRIETILTRTEKEALILEASLIKKHRPRYNVILRDDKNYPLIKVSVTDKWPRITVTRKRIRDGNRYFGPYSSTSSMRKTLKLLQNLFPLRRCRKVKPRKRPCLNFQLGNCLAPCTKSVSKDKYDVMVHNAIMILEGRNRELINELHQNMHQASQSLNFEDAAAIRDQIKGLKQTLENQVISATHMRDQDIFGLEQQDVSAGISILFVRSGLITGAQNFFLPNPIGSGGSILAEALLQYYSEDRQPPPELLLPFQPENTELLQDHLSELSQRSVRIIIPKRGKRLQLMTMADQNARQIFEERDKKKRSWDNLATALQKSLLLSNRPDIIECVDISNISGKQAVGSLVSYKDGVKYTSGYRHYSIRLKDEPDDYAMMREVLARRFEKGKKDHLLPDLLLLDGGKGQLNLAIALVKEFGFEGTIDLAAIAKEKQDGGDRVFLPGRKNHLLLKEHSPVLLFLMRVRDEAHRFGISRHRKLRRKKTLTSELDALKGIGNKRRELLLKKFGSFKRLKKATAAEIMTIPGIGRGLATSIYHQLNEDHETR